MAKEPEIIHSCDGIEEYDNPLPGWWLTMFYGTIVWALVYWVLMPSFWFWDGTLKWGQNKRYDNEVKVAAEATAELESAQTTTGGLQAMIEDPKAIEAGKAVFTQNCAACHGASGEGGIGPSLAKPPYWAYGTGTPADIEFIITKGTNGTPGLNPEAKGGMPPWSQLGTTKIQQVTAFVHSLQAQ